MSGDQAPSQGVSWQSAAVAIAVIAVVGGISITAIVKYSSVDDALKFWSALSGLVGIITGAFVTYFFSRGSLQQAQQDKNQAQQERNQAVQKIQDSADEKEDLLKAAGALAGHLDNNSFQALQNSNPVVASAFSSGRAGVQP